MTTSPDLGIPYIANQQSQPEVTHNEALNVLQIMASGVVDRGVDTPPGAPTEGDAYIVGGSPTGDWAGKANKLAGYFGGSWVFVPGLDDSGTDIPIGARHEGLTVWVRDEDLLYVWNGSTWTTTGGVADWTDLGDTPGSYSGGAGKLLAVNAGETAVEFVDPGTVFSTLDWKQSVRAATTAAGTLSTDFENGDTVDGVTLATGDRILVKDQSTASENGVYVVQASGAPTRATDADADAEVTAGLTTTVEEGISNADKIFVLTTNDPITVGTTGLTFSEISAGASNFLTLTDTPGSYSGNANKVPVVNSGETALEFTDTLLMGDGTEGAPAYSFAADPGTGMRRPAANMLAWSLDGSEGMRFDGALFIGDTANANMDVGLTIKKAAGNNEIVSLKLDTLAHAMTSETEADTFGIFEPRVDPSGGLRIRGYADSSAGAFLFRGIDAPGTFLTSIAAAAGATFFFDSRRGDGAGGSEAHPSGHTSYAFRENNSNVALLTSDGDLHLDTALSENAWDDYDDVALLSGLRGSLLSPDKAAQLGLQRFVEEARPVLENTGVVTYNEDGHHFVAMKGLTFLTIDAIRQVHGRAQERIATLEARLAALEAGNA